LLKALPGDPIEVLIGGAEKDMSAKDLAFLRQEFGLDKSLPEQYFAWLKQTLKGNWGRSYRDERPVSILIGERLPATVFLVGAALLLAVTTGFSWGLLMLWLYQFDDGHLLDDTLLSLAYWVYSMPGFWLGFLAIGALGNLPGLPLKLLGPDNGQINLASLILPAFVLSTRRAAKLALLTRASMIAELKQGYILTARSKGLSFMSVIMKHIVINSLPPLINFLALSIPSLLGGSVLVETVFAWPGLGRLAVDSTFALNYPVLLALIMTYGALVIFSNLFADLIHLAIDPRLRDRIQVV
jgi:peptide/nickel transport system permease protein